MICSAVSLQGNGFGSRSSLTAGGGGPALAAAAAAGGCGPALAAGGRSGGHKSSKTPNILQCLRCEASLFQLLYLPASSFLPTISTMVLSQTFLMSAVTHCWLVWV